jgi:hypothetical protein
MPRSVGSETGRAVGRLELSGDYGGRLIIVAIGRTIDRPHQIGRIGRRREKRDRYRGEDGLAEEKERMEKDAMMEEAAVLEGFSPLVALERLMPLEALTAFEALMALETLVAAAKSLMHALMKLLMRALMHAAVIRARRCRRDR